MKRLFKTENLGKMALFLGVTFGVLLILLAGVLLSNKPSQPDVWPTNTLVPTAEPDTSLITAADLQPERAKMGVQVDGELQASSGTVKLSDLRGKPVVLLFWSSWCDDCKAYMTGDFASAARSAEEAGAEVLLVCREGTRGDDRAQAEAALTAYGIERTTLMDPSASLFRELGLHSVPTLVFIDADGIYRDATVQFIGGETMRAMLTDISGGASGRTAQFLRTMLTAEGAIPSQWQVSTSLTIVPGQSVYSESQGLLMLWAAQTGDRELFDLTYGYVRDQMTVNGLAMWRRAGDNTADVNAALDDLRILEALCLADENWGGYADDITLRADSLYTAAFRNGALRHWAGLSDGSASTDVTLCYLDVAAMQTVARYDSRWMEAAEASTTLLSDQRAIISGDLPLPWPSWSEQEAGYYGTSLHTAESLVCVLNMVRAGIPCEATLDWLEKHVSDGTLWAAYRPDGTVPDGMAYESTAVYALAAQIGIASGRTELTRIALARMDRLRCYDEPMSGGYGTIRDSMLYTFDTIEALLALTAAGR